MLLRDDSDRISIDQQDQAAGSNGTLYCYIGFHEAASSATQTSVGFQFTTQYGFSIGRVHMEP